MAALLFQPHRVTLTTPQVQRNSSNNVTERDYSGGTSRTVKGLFQVRQGRKAIDDSGEVYAYDALLYTKDTGVLLNDLLELPAAFTGGLAGTRFIVLGVEPKHDVQGTFSHVQVLLSKEMKR